MVVSLKKKPNFPSPSSFSPAPAPAPPPLPLPHLLLNFLQAVIIFKELFGVAVPVVEQHVSVLDGSREQAHSRRVSRPGMWWLNVRVVFNVENVFVLAEVIWCNGWIGGWMGVGQSGSDQQFPLESAQSIISHLLCFFSPTVSI